VVGHLLASIPRQRLVELLRQLARIVDQRADDRLSVLGAYFHEHEVPRLSLDERGDLAVVAAEQQVSLPVTRHRTIFGGRRPLADRHRAEDLPTDDSLLRVMPRPTHAARASQVLQ
jgi:hypothetical protein